MEEQYARRNHMEFLSCTIVGRSMPESRAAAMKLVERVEANLSRSKSIKVHCRKGIGRSALIAAGLLMAKASPSKRH